MWPTTYGLNFFLFGVFETSSHLVHIMWPIIQRSTPVVKCCVEKYLEKRNGTLFDQLPF